MVKPDSTIVIGHRNPDADAICSALGYADFKAKTTQESHTAARCGNSNARIDTILQRFAVPLPVFIGDVTPRVQDIMVESVIKVNTDAICMEALQLIDDHDIRTLPVVDADGLLKGSLSIFDLGEYFIPRPREEKRMRRVFTNIDNIVSAIGATVIHTVESDQNEEFFVRIGAMDIRSFGRYYKEDESLARSSIIIVGDRYDIQQRSIQSGVRMVVISGNLPVEEDVIEMAKERDVSLIVSPHDSATTSWIIRSAGRIDDLIREKTANFRPDEKLSMVRRRLGLADSAAGMVTDEHNRLLGVFTKTDLLAPARRKLILVDHNEISQAVPGAEQVNIVEIVDHHRLGNPPSREPIAFINLPVGSTSTIVADQYRRANLSPAPAMAGVLMGGIISDTLNLKGPTATRMDAEMLDWLAGIAETSADDLASTLFNAGSIIKAHPPEKVIRADMKIYEEAAGRFSVSQVEELGFNNLWDACSEIHEALKKLREKEDLLFSALLVTDINSQNSLLLFHGDELLRENITYPHRDSDDIFELDGVVSRKKQLIPYLTNLLRQSFPESTSS
jgi:manganese-dependent inorganic pyrophosphatase